MKPHLLHVFSTFVAAGPQVRTARLLDALGSEYRHSIVALDGRTDARSLLTERVEAEILPAPPRAGTLGTVRRMRALYREVAPDLILTYNWGAIEAVLAARTAGLPVLHHEDGFRPDEVEGFKLRRVLFRRLTLPATRAVIVPSNTLAQIATRAWHLRDGHVHWIPNGIEVDDFPPADRNLERRAALGIPADALVVGSVGHLRPEKNFVRLLEAVAQARVEPTVHVLILGDGPERGAIEEATKRLGLEGRVHLVGHREDTREDYRTMDVFALTSDTEQMPVALLEAMAARLPVIATDVGDVRLILPESQQPYVVSAREGDPAASLAAALEGLADEATRAALAQANHGHVAEHYDFGRMVSAYRARYDAALCRPSAA